MDHKRTTNAFIGNPVERIEDFRFLRGRGQFVDDLTRTDLLHARDPAQPDRARTHPRDRHDRGTGAARRACRHHGDGYRRGGSGHSAAAGCFAGLQAVRATRHRPRQGALCRRAGRARAGRQRRRRRGRARRHRARYRGPAGGRGQRGRRQERRPAGRGRRHEPAAHAERHTRRRRHGVRGRALHAPRKIQRPAPRRGADGAARAHGGLGRSARPAHDLRRRQGRRSPIGACWRS